MCWTWIFTVASAMPSARATSLLLAPRAMWARISRSRADRLVIGSAAAGAAAAEASPWRAWKALTSLLVISGLSTESPAIVRRMAAASMSLSMVLSR